jgi:hypothetical protein
MSLGVMVALAHLQVEVAVFVMLLAAALLEFSVLDILLVVFLLQAALVSGL